MSPMGEVAQKAKTRLSAMVSWARPVLMTWAWSCLRSLMLLHLVSSIERDGCVNMNLLMDVDEGRAQTHGGCWCISIFSSF